MGVVSDGRKAAKLLRRALEHRTAVREVRRELTARGPHPLMHYRVAVYFADGAVNMYQMRQWYKPLAELAKQWPVVVLSRAATGARALVGDDALPVAFVPTVRDLERFIADQDIRVVLYVNQNTRNFQMFRYGRRWHVFINHGESDKMYMTTNQFKAYDYALVAGDAARERLGRVLWDYDLERRAIEIGRPQADHYSGVLPYTPDGRIVVLYAPTWEGDRPSAHYGSIASHGEALARAVLNSSTHRLIYRPHPRSGVVDDQYGAANNRIIAAIAAANVADPTAQHVFDDAPDLGWQLAAADVAVVDISAMVYDRLAAGRPLLVTRPVDPQASIDTHGYLSACDWLDADKAGEILVEAGRVLSDPESAARLEGWVRHYFGDTTPGAATARFHAAIRQLMAEWDRWHALTAGEPVDEDQDDAELDDAE
ncbi:MULTISPECIES: CDP-glycerol glycerophosphotransferase family protein [unclassified Microbacterium]|uniref:CDP-glycerol glycerophosphotransferase family protein n=1 Tax=unclassified Microbacterium TaxID=2609290 RepID=UPI00214CF31D|nr:MULTISPECIES: CDP-glycerol glycerophosphotransferase family protein [unclassified Microbacterium]MCR2784499.1 CDP-glycerol glycerophosphotransferase family protein [Microbacterium sp. zg.B96]MDL5350592.1 CDP-glycerol glycerophosphotransferase family protein [Microbacterium sp. zg-YB36]WIM14689.1 CDP-glycerol glycerophosphotransferase family protein [Microbacterium sp. zg-B96]